MLKEAILYKKLEDNKISCYLCSHRCQIPDGKFGICSVRQNKKGVLYTHAYREVVAANIDPIEKKPLFHFLPGSKSFSIATAGCNFRCGFCQNWRISQKTEFDKLGGGARDIAPEEVVALAKKSRCQSISYTYTEPTVFFEYAWEISRLAKKEGIKNVFVTNGYMTKEALEEIAPFLDAANVDLKSFRDSYYRKTCGASLEPVKESIKLMHQLKIWVEITTLIVPTLNDSKEELKGLADFIASVGIEIPWHISRFHPEYKVNDLESTPVETLKMAQAIGKKSGLRHVYLGNVPLEGENTYCYKCNELLIERYGFSILQQKINKSRCPKCDSVVEGVF